MHNIFIRLLPVMEDRATLESDLSARRGLAGRRRLNTGAAVFSAKAAAPENKSDKLIPRASRIYGITPQQRSIDMGKTSNQSKQQWNDRNYVQMKISIAPGIAAAFKAKCAASGVSVTSELTRLMGGKSANRRIQKPNADMYRTRRLRRSSLEVLIEHIEAMRDAEQYYLDAMPDNLGTSPMHDAAEEIVSALDDALDSLYGAF